MSHNLAKKRLVPIIKNFSKVNFKDLGKMRKEGKEGFKNPNFLWHYLLQSFATMGNSSGWAGLIGTPSNYDRVTYESLNVLSSSVERQKVACEVCAIAKVRMPNRKGGYISGCFDKIYTMGGPEAAKKILQDQLGKDAKIFWLKQLPGIGDKYSRNIMMDVYHEDFRDSIAIDVRIKSISKKLGISFISYAEHENFYLEVAKDSGIDGWTLDRILYNYKNDIENSLN